jgi:hypothetical protein
MRIGRLVAVLALLMPRIVAAAEPFPAKDLIDASKRYHLPMPPVGARLVLAHTESWSVLGNESTSRDPAIYSPAFLLEEKADGNILILRGTQQEWIEHQHDNEPRWRPFSDKVMKPVLGGYISEFNRVSAFVCAVQLAARGETATAERLWRKIETSEWLSDADPHENVRAELKNPRLLLAKAISWNLKNRVLDTPNDWPEIYNRLKDLLDGFPSLKAEPRCMGVLEGLAAALEARPAPTNSTEALLVDWSRIPRDRKDPSRVQDSSSGNRPRAQIVLRGAEAVPDLIQLLNDRRITTHEFPAFMNAPSRVRLLGELAQELLEDITGVKGKSPWEHADPSEFRAWLEKSRQTGEEQMLVHSVFTRAEGKITEVNEAPAMILAQKFPKSLPSLCEEFSRDAKPEAQPFALAEALAGSGLPKATKVEALAGFARRGSLEHKRAVLQCLAPLDPQECSEILLPIIENLPTDSTGAYWTCPEAALTHCVMLLENDGIWRAYLVAAKRSSVGLRMEMMNPMDYTYIGQTNRTRRLAFLAAFLSDQTKREIPKDEEHSKYSGPCAAFTIKRIAVRDFVAEEIGCILNLPGRPDEFWTPAQWTAFRDTVERRLADEKLPTL